MPRLPLLDIAEWRGNPEQFAGKLRAACHHIGFFQLQARLPTGCTQRVAQVANDFFARPIEQKMVLDYRRSSAFRGYMALGCENTSGKVDFREQVEFAPERESPTITADSAPYERLRGANQWPAEQPELREAVDDFTTAMTSLSWELTAALCMALCLQPGSLDALFGDEPHWQMKLANYPAEASNNREDSGDNKIAGTVGVGAHTDSGFLTLVLQDDAGGLQVQ
jgi:isopenicillin N synthase-like dioxygenase